MTTGDGGARRRCGRAMGVLERWDRHNQEWAADAIRDPDRRTGVWVIAVLGGIYAVATAVAAHVGEWRVAVVSGVKAQVFLMVALVVVHGVRRRRAGLAPFEGSERRTG